MDSIFKKIRENTKNMNTRQKIEYIGAYYWYHLLGVVVFVALLIFLIFHFGFPEEKPLFTCAIVNLKVNYEQDEFFKEEFAKFSGISSEQIVFDSDYIISYDGVNLSEKNEGYFDKFLFQWSCGELDAVVMSRDFFSYCLEIGGAVYLADEFETEDLKLCKISDVCVIELTDTVFAKQIMEESEELVLVFPKTGQHIEHCQKFINYIACLNDDM